MSKLTYLDVLKETKKFYAKDTSRRSLSMRSCKYLDVKGNHCAVSRCLNLSEDRLKKLDNLYGSSVKVLMNSHHIKWRYFKKRYRHLRNIDFWNKLQKFHDTYEFWDESGITERGLLEYRILKKEYKNG